MADDVIEPSLFAELQAGIQRATATGQLPNSEELTRQTTLFRDRFGPEALRQIDGEALLQAMHGRQDAGQRCLDYWLEFKNDDEFTTRVFGSIAGGSALKFEIFQRPSDGTWIGGSSRKQRVLTTNEAIAVARRQRDELIAGAAAIEAMRAGDASDPAYSALQETMERVAPTTSSTAWAHKYWALLHPDGLDFYHMPGLQRFHLLKLLQMPPDRKGLCLPDSPRFNCAGRFVSLARDIGVPMPALNRFLESRSGALHSYWKVGTTSGSSGQSFWAGMRDGNFVAIGWADAVRDLTNVITLEYSAAKADIRGRLAAADYAEGIATRKAGEILNFAKVMAERDIVLACEGETILGIGEVIGRYEYDGSLRFPHKRPVKWLSLDTWHLPENEGPRTTVYQVGRTSATNVLETERRLAHRTPLVPTTAPRSAEKPLPALTGPVARVQAILQRKGQVILYGPPGTGKTYTARLAAVELAARHSLRKTFAELTQQEIADIEKHDGLVRTCTFHPGWGYEDFMEGLRPVAKDDRLAFEPRDGVFKRLCTDAREKLDTNFYLVIDEINRGDIPRIFGELLTVLEYDKRGKEITLPITGDPFSVPRNVFLLGTMNTADRSISLLDAALRRRFGFIELMPDSSMLKTRAGTLRLGLWLDALNIRLRRHLKRDARNLQVGHSYLLPGQVASFADFARVLRDDILPLLEEYCYDDPEMLKAIAGDIVDVQDGGRIREELFEPNREDALLDAVSFPEMDALVQETDASDEESAGDHDDDQAHADHVESSV
jgi:5-methylcytosine-specific restriction protein B